LTRGTGIFQRSHAALANITATLGSSYSLGFETSDLSSDKKRLAFLGAQRRALAPGENVVVEVQLWG